MNNKGFAVTGIIYGIMLLFVLVVTSFLTIIVGRNRRVDALVDGVYDKVNYYTETITLDDTNAAFITQRKGLYKINYNGEYVNSVDTVEIVNSDDEQVIEYYKDAVEEIYKPYKNLKYYD